MSKKHPTTFWVPRVPKMSPKYALPKISSFLLGNNSDRSLYKHFLQLVELQTYLSSFFRKTHFVIRPQVDHKKEHRKHNNFTYFRHFILGTAWFFVFGTGIGTHVVLIVLFILNWRQNIFNARSAFQVPKKVKQSTFESKPVWTLQRKRLSNIHSWLA